MASIKFTIKAWNAWKPGLDSIEAWQLWAEGKPTPIETDAPKAKSIKPMLRRRLSKLGHIALATAEPIAEKYPNTPCVFCSRHGELERTVSLLKASAANEDLSPTHFSLSVHNAIGGIYSMAYKNTSAITAIACSDGDTSTAFLEAATQLFTSKNNEVLCIIYDEPLPYPYPKNKYLPYEPYAAAFLLSKDSADADQYAIDLNLLPKSSNNDRTTSEPDIYTLIRFLLSSDSQLTLSAPRHQWLWTKDNVL